MYRQVNLGDYGILDLMTVSINPEDVIISIYELKKAVSYTHRYMAFAVLDELVRKGDVQMNYETAEKTYIKAICKGLFKIMSKMGCLLYTSMTFMPHENRLRAS